MSHLQNESIDLVRTLLNVNKSFINDPGLLFKKRQRNSDSAESQELARQCYLQTTNQALCHLGASCPDQQAPRADSHLILHPLLLGL